MLFRSFREWSGAPVLVVLVAMPIIVVLLPVWDMLFGTANFELRYDPTGIRDQVEPDARGRLRDYGEGFWSQQWRGVLRLMGRA